MIHLYYFLRFAKNNLHLELGVGCFYSTSCREGKFSETHIQPVASLSNATGAMGIIWLSVGPMTQASCYTFG